MKTESRRYNQKNIVDKIWSFSWSTAWKIHIFSQVFQIFSNERLETVQRRATKMVHGFHNLKYHERLSQLGLTTLRNRRLRGDLIETYKLLTNKEDIDSQQFFQLTEDPYQLRGNNRRTYKVRSRGEIRRNFFSQRVLDHWNNLPQEIIVTDSVNIFKSRLDKFWRHTADMGQ